MNPPSSSVTSSGERKLRAQELRRAAPQVLLFILGLVAGIGLVLAEENLLPRPSPALAWTGAAALATAVVLATAFWLRRVDEVEIADQLWASFVGLNGFFITAICWEILAAASAAPPVHRSALYVGTAAVTAVTYFWRRFRRA